MPQPRLQQVSLEDTPFYHCSNYCVRGAHLCGVDRLTGKSFEQRRKWIEKRLFFYQEVFTIHLVSFAIMPDHFHLILSVDTQLNERLSDMEVLERYHKIHKGTQLTQAFVANESLNKRQHKKLDSDIQSYRKRLSDISWYMRNFNEFIARQANAEESRSGRFWEGRFKIQAILDQIALITCMAYVDLNPIRNKMARTLETSVHSSISNRVRQLKVKAQSAPLLPLSSAQELFDIPIQKFVSEEEFIILLSSSCRILNQERHNPELQEMQAILSSMAIDQKTWMTLTTQFEECFCYAAGQAKLLQSFKRNTDRHRIRGMAKAKSLMPEM